MEREKLESLLIEYIDGTLSDADRTIVERILAEDKEAQLLHVQLSEVMGVLNASPVWEPSAAMQQKFDASLASEIAKEADNTSAKQKIVFFSPVFYRAAATVGVILFLAGYWIYKDQRQAREMEALRKEMDATKQIMMAMLDNQQSASSRVRGATVAFNMEKTDDQIVAALVRTMNEDPNTNVRLAALEALGKFNGQPHVRKALVASLVMQKDPVVQIALIQLMVRMKEKGAVKDLENIVRDNDAMKAVKDEAYSGLLKLS